MSSPLIGSPGRALVKVLTCRYTAVQLRVTSEAGLYCRGRCVFLVNNTLMSTKALRLSSNWRVKSRDNHRKFYLFFSIFWFILWIFFTSLHFGSILVDIIWVAYITIDLDTKLCSYRMQNASIYYLSIYLSMQCHLQNEDICFVTWYLM